MKETSDSGISAWHIVGMIAGLILGGIIVYFNQGGCNFHVDYYDGLIEESEKKLNSTGCFMPAEADSAKDIYCKDLLYEHNKLIRERNSLYCVENG